MILDYNRLSSSCSIKENNFAMRIQRKISRNRNRKTEAVYSLVMRKLSATLVGEKNSIINTTIFSILFNFLATIHLKSSMIDH